MAEGGVQLEMVLPQRGQNRAVLLTALAQLEHRADADDMTVPPVTRNRNGIIVKSYCLGLRFQRGEAILKSSAA